MLKQKTDEALAFSRNRRFNKKADTSAKLEQSSIWTQLILITMANVSLPK
jgi:hypothetical protein